MKYIKVDPNIQKNIVNIIQKQPRVMNILRALIENGATVLLVGGAVRDVLLSNDIKDLDFEIYGLGVYELQAVLMRFGDVSFVGKAFGVFRLHGLSIDWSVPRKDSIGRKPEVILDANLSFKEAFVRRDLTINAMGINIATYELIDPFNGYDDLKKGILRTPDAAFFVQDPLRFFRVMQFIARFDMYPDESLNALCSTMDISSVSRERIEQEFNKVFLMAQCPSLSFRWLDSLSRLQEILPELAATKNVTQDRQWHPEGDVFEHTMQAIDAGALLPYDQDVQQKLAVMYALLCHDLGKVSTTRIVDGSIRSPGHAEAGVPLAQSLLKRITNNQVLIAQVSVLVLCHMRPIQLVRQSAHLSAYKRLALKIAPLSLQTLALVVLADKRGRNPKKNTPLSITLPEIDFFLARAQEAGVLIRPEDSVLTGKDLLDCIKPGKLLGKALKKAYEIQINEGIRSKSILKDRIVDLLEKKYFD